MGILKNPSLDFDYGNFEEFHRWKFWISPMKINLQGKVLLEIN